MNFNIQWFDNLSSTNSFLSDCLRKVPLPPSGTIIAARNQTAGRGRGTRSWIASPNASLCFSLYIKNDAEPAQMPSLSMAAALAVNDLMNRAGISSVPKWPNDVLVGDKKICGILSERVETRNGTGIIIGIGLNTNMTNEEAGAIDRPATSMLIESGRAQNTDQILKDLLPLLEFWIEQWELGGFQTIKEVWTEKAGPIGKSISVHDGDIKKIGTLAGFGEHGELLLQTKNGMETIWSGDVS